MNQFDWTTKPKRVLIVGGRSQQVETMRLAILHQSDACVQADPDGGLEHSVIATRRSPLLLVSNTKRTAVWTQGNVRQAHVSYDNASFRKQVQGLRADVAENSRVTGVVIVDCDRGDPIDADIVREALGDTEIVVIVNARDISAYVESVRDGSFDTVIALRTIRLPDRRALYSAVAPAFDNDETVFDTTMSEYACKGTPVVFQGAQRWCLADPSKPVPVHVAAAAEEAAARIDAAVTSVVEGVVEPAEKEEEWITESTEEPTEEQQQQHPKGEDNADTNEASAPPSLSSAASTGSSNMCVIQ